MQKLVQRLAPFSQFWVTRNLRVTSLSFLPVERVREQTAHEEKDFEGEVKPFGYLAKLRLTNAKPGQTTACSPSPSSTYPCGLGGAAMRNDSQIP
jgi:hypothetical protein